jgi:uncharacterized protein (TIRG00374 family)
MDQRALHLPSSHAHVLAGWRFKAMIFAIIFSSVGYLLAAFWGGWTNVAEAIAQAGFLGIAAALALSLVNYGMRFVRWQIFLRTLGYQVPTWPSLRIYVGGFSLTPTPGKAGEMLRSVFLKDFGVPYQQCFGTFLAERLSDLMAILLLTSFGLWNYPDARPTMIVLGLIVCLVLILSHQEKRLKAADHFAKKFLPTRLARLAEFMVETTLAFKSCFAIRVVVLIMILGIIAWAAEGYALYMILCCLGYDLGFLMSMFIYGFALLIGGISFLPGGLGGTEITLLHFLTLNEIPISAAVAATLLIRLATLWFSVLLGLMALPKALLYK